MLDDLENVLKAMPLRQPSAAMDDKVRAAMSGELNPDADLEAKVGSLPLRRPSSALDAKVRAVLAGVPSLRFRRPVLPWSIAGLAMAAAIGMLAVSLNIWYGTGDVKTLAIGDPIPPATQPAETFLVQSDLDKQDAVTSVKQIETNTVDEGIVQVVANQPVRRIRQHTTERVLLVDNRTNTTVEMTIPRDEVYNVQEQMY